MQSKPSIEKQWDKWLSEGDAQRLWSHNYILKNPEFSEYIAIPFSDVSRCFKGIAAKNLYQAELLLKKMQAAWTQKKYRDKGNGRKGYSFVMSTGVASKLKSLAKDSHVNINVALEAMILNNDQFRKDLVERRKIEVSQHEQKSSGVVRNFKARFDLQKLEAKKGFEKRDEVIRLLKEELDGVVFEKCKRDQLLKDTDCEDASMLMEGEVSEAKQATQKYMLALEKRIESLTKHIETPIRPRRINRLESDASVINLD